MAEQSYASHAHRPVHTSVAGLFTLLAMRRRLRGPLERHFRGRVAARFPQDAAPELEGVGVGLEREGAVQREQRAALVVHPVGRDAQLVPHESQIGVALDGLLERGERFRELLQLHQRRAHERERKGGIGERRLRGPGDLQRLRGAPLPAQQLEVLSPTGFEIGVLFHELAIGGLRVLEAPFAREPPRARHRPFAGRIGEQVERGRRAHGRRIYARENRWPADDVRSTFSPRMDRQRLLQDLTELLRIPSVSTLRERDTDCRRAAEWVAAELRALGCGDVALLGSETHPVVWGTGPRVPGAPVLLIYGHYDVQPPDPLGEWTTPPFEPSVRDGRVYARGACDDKGQVFCLLRAIAAAGRPPPIAPALAA